MHQVIGPPARYSVLIASGGRTMRQTRINGDPGFIVYVSRVALAAMILHIRDDRVHTVYAIANPDKLQTVPAQPE